MTTRFDSVTRNRKPSFGRGLSFARRQPFTAADLQWAAYELNKDATDYTVLTSEAWDAMAAESFALARLEPRLCC